MKNLKWPNLSMRQSGPKAILIASLMCGSILPAHAEQKKQQLNLTRAVKLTLINNPELNLYPLAIRGSEALQTQAELKPIPILGVDINNAFGSGNYQTVDSAEISLSLSQLVEMGDKRQSRVKYAKAETQILKTEYELARLDILAETSRRYYQALHLQETQSWIERRVKKEQAALLTIQQRAKAGAVGQADVSKMALRLAHSKILQQQLKSQLKLAKLRLTAMWLAEPDFNTLAGSLNLLPEVPNLEFISSALDKLPAFLHELALNRLADSQLKLAQANGKSNMTLGITLKQHQLSNDQSLGLNFSMPIAFENPNQGRIKSAQIRLDKSHQQTNWRKQQLRLTLNKIQQQLVASIANANVLKNVLLPQAKKLLNETLLGYKKGRYSVLQWVDAQSELFLIEESLMKNHLQIHNQYLELERITGQSMSSNMQDSAGEK